MKTINYCPECGMDLTSCKKTVKYCPQCGQKMDEYVGSGAVVKKARKKRIVPSDVKLLAIVKKYGGDGISLSELSYQLHNTMGKNERDSILNTYTQLGKIAIRKVQTDSRPKTVISYVGG